MKNSKIVLSLMTESQREREPTHIFRVPVVIRESMLEFAVAASLRWLPLSYFFTFESQHEFQAMQSFVRVARRIGSQALSSRSGCNNSIVQQQTKQQTKPSPVVRSADFSSWLGA